MKSNSRSYNSSIRQIPHHKLTSNRAPSAAGFGAATRPGEGFAEPVQFQRTVKAGWDGATPEGDSHSVLFIR